jgi:uncharacterized membrane protein YbhN (UPF0104 family)
MTRDKRIVRWLWRLGPVLVLALAALLIRRALSGFSLADIQRALRLLSPVHLALAGLLTVASHVMLTFSEALAMRYARRELPFRKVAFTSFVSIALGHTLGFGAVSSGAIRLRLYTSFGLDAGVVPHVIVSCGLTVLLGLSTVAGIGAIARPELSASALHLAPDTIVLLGCVLLAGALTYLTLTAVLPRELRVRGHALRVPTLRMALGQLVIGTTDCLLVAGVLHQTLAAASAGIDYASVLTLYSVANAAAIVTHVPGGLGVIEALVLATMPTAPVIGALIAFRAVYYLVPFIVGCVLFAGFELSRRLSRRGALRRNAVRRWRGARRRRRTGGGAPPARPAARAAGARFPANEP